MITQNASLVIGFKGAAKINGVPMYVHQLPLTVGGVVDDLETVNPAFGLLVSAHPDDPHSFRVGIPAGYTPRGILMADPAILENDPGKPAEYMPGGPATAILYGPFQLSTWGKTAAGAIDPVIGCKIIASKTTGAIEFVAASTNVAPTGWIFLNAAVIDKEFDANGVTIFMNAGNIEELPVVAIPTALPVPGTYATAQNVALTSDTSAATIYYTTDGTEPTEDDTEYTTAIAIAATTTLKARAFKTGYAPSPIFTGVYTITA